jgi:hypothetical protein
MSKPPCLPGETRYQATARLQRERREAREAAQKAARRRAISGGRFRSGAHKPTRKPDWQRNTDRINGYDRESQDF